MIYIYFFKLNVVCVCVYVCAYLSVCVCVCVCDKIYKSIQYKLLQTSRYMDIGILREKSNVIIVTELLEWQLGLKF